MKLAGLENIIGLQNFLNNIKLKNMFNFFKKNKKRTQLLDWERDLLLKILSDLGGLYRQYVEQIKEGIIEGVRLNDKIPDYTGFRLNVKLLNKYERRSQIPYTLSNILVFNEITKQVEHLKIHLGFGLVLGYEVTNSNFIPNLDKIDIKEMKILNEKNLEFDEIKDLFTNEEVRYINTSEVYLVELDGNKYYHLFDLEDGDFVGIDANKQIFEITHDPFLIKKLDVDLIDVLKRKSNVS